jgi:hypothetical protein
MRLIIPMIIQTILLDPSGAVWTDEASNVSRPDPSGADQIDAEHQATDLAVGVRFARSGSSFSRPAGSKWLQISRTLLAVPAEDDGAKT